MSGAPPAKRAAVGNAAPVPRPGISAANAGIRNAGIAGEGVFGPLAAPVMTRAQWAAMRVDMLLREDKKLVDELQNFALASGATFPIIGAKRKRGDQRGGGVGDILKAITGAATTLLSRLTGRVRSGPAPPAAAPAAAPAARMRRKSGSADALRWRLKSSAAPLTVAPLST